jgi:uncharacterized protein (DUF4415 family)
MKTPPPPKKSKAKSTPPNSNTVEPKIDTPRGIKKPVQLKLDVEIVKEFKQLALDEEKNMNELFVEMLRLYKNRK